MPTKDDRLYFERRAETELELAQRSRHPNAVRAHYQLASHYLDLVHGAPDAQTFGDRRR